MANSRLILAVAGSGKTSYLLDQLDTEQRSLVIAYTNSNISALSSRIVQKFGYHPENITVLSYFSFLYSFCYKPFLHLKIGAEGINYKRNPNHYAKNRERYIDSANRLYSNRLAQFISKVGVADDVCARLSKYFDQILVDEFQDFGGHDFNFLPVLMKADADVVCVGDFFQHTFSTSKDGVVRKNLHKDIGSFSKECVDINLELDQDTLSNSYRCSPTVCEFVVQNLGINIASHRTDAVDVDFVTDISKIHSLLQDDGIVKLFYQSARKYDCRSKNWGESKGDDDFDSVCVVLNATSLKAFESGTLASLAPITLNKLYVACTRARGNLYFVPENLLKDYKAP